MTCLSHMAYFTKHNALQVHSCCCKWQDLLIFKGWMIFHCVCVCVCIHICTYSSPLNNMTLNCEAPLIRGFFPTNTVLVFSLYKSLKFVWLEITVCGTKRIRVWVLILCKLFQFLPLGESLINPFIFEAEILITQIFTRLGAWHL